MGGVEKTQKDEKKAKKLLIRVGVFDIIKFKIKGENGGAVC